MINCFKFIANFFCVDCSPSSTRLMSFILLIYIMIGLPKDWFNSEELTLLGIIFTTLVGKMGVDIYSKHKHKNETESENSEK